MEDILKLISTYEIMVNFIPGTLFTFLIFDGNLGKYTTGNMVIDIVLMYIAGIITGRFGSLFIQKYFIYNAFVKKYDYKVYLLLQESNVQFERLTIKADMYRNIVAVFMLVSIKYIFENFMLIVKTSIFDDICLKGISLMALSIIFVFSYISQSNYIWRRIENYKEDHK